MNKREPRKLLTFPTHRATQQTVSIHPDIWAEAIRPSDPRDLRLDKIADLRTAIAAGTYRVSAADLAEKLIQHMRSNA